MLQGESRDDMCWKWCWYHHCNDIDMHWWYSRNYQYTKCRVQKSIKMVKRWKRRRSELGKLSSWRRGESRGRWVRPTIMTTMTTMTTKTRMTTMTFFYYHLHLPLRWRSKLGGVVSWSDTASVNSARTKHWRLSWWRYKRVGNSSEEKKHFPQCRVHVCEWENTGSWK